VDIARSLVASGHGWQTDLPTTSEDNRTMIRCMPVLQVADVKRSEAFYCEKLGFRSHGAWGDGPDFAIVHCGRITIALDRSRDDGPVPLNQYWAAYIYVEDADSLCEQMRRNGVEVVRGPEDMFYGSRDFDIRDPDGHLLAFGHDLEPDKADPGPTQA
jgi:catechol 2,3-dioxygenase-like lactoylglutathione lyase family enzyme